jgi:hypothetical protein
MLNYKEFFSIGDNFTLTELKDARNKKLYNLLKLNIPNIDKQIYSSQINKVYRIAKLDISARTVNLPEYQLTKPFRINNYEKFFSNYSESKSYREKLLPDNSKVVLEEIKKNNNGKEENIFRSYKILPSGIVTEYDIELAKELLN